MKKYALAIFLSSLSFYSFSQVKRSVSKQPADTSANAEKFSDHRGNKKELIKELDLTPEQKIKFKEVNQAHKASKNAVENDSSLSAEQKKEKMKSLRKDQMEKLKTILTPEQMEKFRRTKKHKAE